MRILPISPGLELFAKWVQQRALANDTFKVPRFVVGPSAYNFMLWHLCETYCTQGVLRRELEDFIEVCRPAPGLVPRECLVVMAGPGQNNREFVSKHFLDAVRTHLVLMGSGRLATPKQVIDYEPGAVFAIDPAEVNQTSSRLEAHSVHVVVFWTTPDAGPVWSQYAKA
jgi:hypothetical protein